ncbi:MAG: hypothetical protein IK118_07120 [Clostridia bacterium]|nr:hypothetical protein [Clostridia bacterium]
MSKPKGKYARIAAGAAAILIAAIAVVCVVLTIKKKPAGPANEPTTKIEAVAGTQVGIENGRDGRALFALTPQAFIDEFNRYYSAANGDAYLRSPARWRVSEFDAAPHGRGETVVYNFSRDEQIWSLPTVSIYVPAGEARICEITLNFDDHSFTPELFAEYKELCRCALRVFFPDKDDRQTDALIGEMIAFADENILPDTQWYGADSVPQVAYIRNGIACYPYFAFGDWLRICIVPVDRELEDEFEAAGTQVRKY